MRSGSAVMLSALAMADTLTLLIGTTWMYINKVYNTDIEKQFLLICKTNRYLKSVFSYVANWLVIIFTIFRVIAVYWPHMANIYCTPKESLHGCASYLYSQCPCKSRFINFYWRHIPKYNRAGRFMVNLCWFEGSSPYLL